MSSADKRIYFSGLNGLRFCAALSVLITHVELIKGKLGYTNYWENHFLHNLAGLGVSFFFVLSGFLITFLLLTEIERKQDVDVKKFYFRRVLRIWPLYLFITVLGFFVFPNIGWFEMGYFSDKLDENFSSNLLLYLVMLPNVAGSIYASVPLIGQAWSVGVEEQFYILWPWFIRWFKNKVLTGLIIFFVFIMLMKLVALVIIKTSPDPEIYRGLRFFMAGFKVELMAIGGGLAYFAFKDESKLDKLKSSWILIGSIVGVFTLMMYTPDVLQDGIHVVYGLLFCLIILNVTMNERSVLKLENRFWNFLGGISYGVYMYHLIILFIVLKFFHEYFGFQYEGILENVTAYLSCLGLTILVSHLSFKYFERPFLRIKAKFTVVESGKNE